MVWCDEEEAGCTFDQELPLTTVDHLLGKSVEKLSRSVFGLKGADPPSSNDNIATPLRSAREGGASSNHPHGRLEMAPPEQVWIAASFSRGGPRDRASSSAAYQSGLKRSPVDVVSISPAGAKICTVEPVETGATFWIKLPNLEPVEMCVAWVTGLEAGCTFLDPLDPATFQVVAQAAR